MANTGRMGGSLTVVPRGDRLRALRKNLNFRQHEVAEMAGIPAGYLSHYERNQPITIEYIGKLANFYGVSAREITQPDSMATAMQIATKIASVFDGQLTFVGVKAENAGAEATL
jgi:transcriptional regulator with XRE-family HTH domain